MTYIFKTKNGTTFIVNAKDADRARVLAKREASNKGIAWHGAKLVKMTNTV